MAAEYRCPGSIKDAPSFGFGAHDNSWLPQPTIYGELAVDQQDGVPGSTLEFYRRMVRERRARALGNGSLTWVEGPEHTVSFVNTRPGHEDLWVVTNLGEPVELPQDAFVVLRSDDDESLTVGTDVTMWFTRG